MFRFYGLEFITSGFGVRQKKKKTLGFGVYGYGGISFKVWILRLKFTYENYNFFAQKTTIFGKCWIVDFKYTIAIIIFIYD